MQKSFYASLTAAGVLFAVSATSAHAVLVTGWGLETGAANATLTEGVAGSFSTTTPTGNASPRALFSSIPFTVVGTTVTLSGTVTLQNVPGNIQFRVGLYDTNAAATGTLSGGTWTGANNVGWSGYLGEPRNLAGGGATVVQGRNATGAWFSGTGAYTLTADTFTDGGGNGSAGGTYDFSLTFERLSASSIGVDFSFVQAAGTGSVNISGSYTDSVGTSSTLDNLNAVGFLLNANTGSGSFTDVDVSVVPEPSSFAAFAGLFASAVCLLRRRRA